jgi:hypothetical protein
MARKALTDDEQLQIIVIRDRLWDDLREHQDAVVDAGLDTGKLADAIAAAQATLARAYADVTLLVARQK